ncbi:MAG TPA: YggT family protein [Salinisphaeraceae bacterium]|nr:YggT family protein [Salinisphaeraceae bacterium]
MFSNATSPLLFLINTLFALYVIVVIVRILLQLTHAATFHNPISHFVQRLTARPVGLLAMGVPRWRNVDVPAMVFAVLLCFVNIEIVLFLTSAHVAAQPLLPLWWALLKTLTLLCEFYFFAILVQALLSWFSPRQFSPATAILWNLNEPLLRPVRSRLPSIGGLDLSPIVILIALQVVNMILLGQIPPLLR